MLSTAVWGVRGGTIVAAKLLREDDEVVYGDNAYLGIEKRDEIKQDKHLSAKLFTRACAKT